jgi:hypothetical protein
MEIMDNVPSAAAVNIESAEKIHTNVAFETIVRHRQGSV